jgi:hypothetical protein
VPIGEVELTLYGEQFTRGKPLADPVQYFWSRGGVTAKIRGEIQRILES